MRYVGSAAGRVHCPRDARCALCAGEHHTDRHKCPVDGYLGKKGQTCAQVVTKCVNCRGTLPIMPSRWEAKQAAGGWRSPTRYRVAGGCFGTFPAPGGRGDRRRNTPLRCNESMDRDVLSLGEMTIKAQYRIAL